MGKCSRCVLYHVKTKEGGMIWLHTKGFLLCVYFFLVFYCNFSFSWFDSFFSTRFLKSLPGPVLTSDWPWRTTASCWNPLAAMPGIKIVPVSLCFEPSQLSVTHGTSCSIQNPQRTNGVTVWGLWLAPRWEKVFPVSCKSDGLSERLFCSGNGDVTFAVESWCRTEVSHSLKKKKSTLQNCCCKTNKTSDSSAD